MNWLGFSLLSLGLWGVWGFLSKVATRCLPPQTVYLLAISGHLLVVAYLLMGPGVTLPRHGGGIAASVGAGVCMAVGLLCFLHALAQGQAAAVVPLTALYPVITVILSVVLLQESFTLRRLAGVTLAMGAVWLLSE